MKSKIICLVGPSGSGKTYMATHLEEEYGIPQIQSRTTRPRRTPDETGHTFVTDEEFDTYEDSHMIAFTTFGGSRYCCLHKDVNAPTISYVIDEAGLKYLRENFSNIYSIFAVRLFMPEEKRKLLVGEERIMRDEGKFLMGIDDFDYFICTEDFSENERKICKMLIRCYQHFDTNP